MHFSRASFAHLPELDQVGGFLLDPLLVQLLQFNMPQPHVLEVLLGLGVNVKAMRHRSPLSSLNELFNGATALGLVAHDPSVDVDVVNAQRAALRLFFRVQVVLVDRAIWLQALWPRVGRAEVVLSI